METIKWRDEREKAKARKGKKGKWYSSPKLTANLHSNSKYLNFVYNSGALCLFFLLLVDTMNWNGSDQVRRISLHVCCRTSPSVFSWFPPKNHFCLHHRKCTQLDGLQGRPLPLDYHLAPLVVDLVVPHVNRLQPLPLLPRYLNHSLWSNPVPVQLQQLQIRPIQPAKQLQSFIANRTATQK